MQNKKPPSCVSAGNNLVGYQHSANNISKSDPRLTQQSEFKYSVHV